MFSEWNILSVEGQREQRTADTVKQHSLGEAVIATNSKRSRGRKFSGKGSAIVWKTTDPLQNTSQRVGTHFQHLSHLPRVSFPSLLSGADDASYNTTRTWAFIKHDGRAVFRNHTGFRFTSECSVLSVQKQNSSNIFGRATDRKNSISSHCCIPSLAQVNKCPPLVVAFLWEIQTPYEALALQKVGEAGPSNESSTEWCNDAIYFSTLWILRTHAMILTLFIQQDHLYLLTPLVE